MVPNRQIKGQTDKGNDKDASVRAHFVTIVALCNTCPTLKQRLSHFVTPVPLCNNYRPTL